MTLKAPLNPWHMVPNSMEVYIAKDWWDTPLQVGFYKDQSLSAAGESLEDVYSNGTIKKIKDWDKVSLSIDVHELTVEKLAILQSWLIEVHAGTVSGEVETYLPGQWDFNKGLLLKYAAGDGTAISPTSVKALIDWTDTSLTASTDYSVWVTQFGETYIKILAKDTEHSSRTLEEGDNLNVKITITYSATNADAKVIEHKANSMAAPFVMWLINEFEYDGQKKTIKTKLENCLADKTMLQQIADSDNTTVGFPLTITGVVHSQEFVGFSMNS